MLIRYQAKKLYDIYNFLFFFNGPGKDRLCIMLCSNITSCEYWLIKIISYLICQSHEDIINIHCAIGQLTVCDLTINIAMPAIENYPDLYTPIHQLYFVWLCWCLKRFSYCYVLDQLSMLPIALVIFAVVYAILSNDTDGDIPKPHYSFIVQLCPVDCFLVNICRQSNIQEVYQISWT